MPKPSSHISLPLNKENVELDPAGNPHFHFDERDLPSPLAIFAHSVYRKGVLRGFTAGTVLGAAIPMALFAAAWLSGAFVKRDTTLGEEPNSPVPSYAQKYATPTPSPTETLPTTPEECVAALPFDVKIGQKLVLGVTENNNTVNKMSDVKSLFAQSAIGGIVLMEEPKDMATSNDTLNNFLKAQPIKMSVAEDNEGGTVQRILFNGKRIAAQADVGEMSYKEQQAFIKNVLGPMYEYLASRGVTAVYGPVLDVNDSRAKGSPIPSRAFGDDPRVVSELSAWYAKAAKESGLLPTLKHAPGLGDAKMYNGSTGNTDQGAMLTGSWSEVKKIALQPYQKVADEVNGEMSVMMGTQTVPGLTTGDKNDQMPAALSSAAVDEMRRIFGDEVLIVSDDLNTNTIKKMPGRMLVSDAAVLAFAAGVDQALIVTPNSSSYQNQIEKIVLIATDKAKEDNKFAAQIDDSVRRIMDFKKVDPCKALEAVVEK